MRTTQGLAALALSLLVPGCHLSHGTEPTGDGGIATRSVDAGPRRVDAGLRRVDAGAPDAGSDAGEDPIVLGYCEAETPVALCASRASISAIVRTALNIEGCTATVESEPGPDEEGEIVLDTYACTPAGEEELVEVECPLGSRTVPGAYRVRTRHAADGLDVFRVRIGTGGGGVGEGEGPTCTGSVSDRCDDVAPDPTFDRLCFPTTVPPGQPWEARYEGDCVACNRVAPTCSVRVTSGFLGTAIDVGLSAPTCETARCLEECAPLASTCASGALLEGTHPLFVGGEQVGEIAVGGTVVGPERCVPLP